MSGVKNDALMNCVRMTGGGRMNDALMNDVRTRDDARMNDVLTNDAPKNDGMNDYLKRNPLHPKRRLYWCLQYFLPYLFPFLITY